jgi:hypothetical protein
MKKILSLFFFLSPLLILSQNYKLFHSASKKLFASTNSLMTYSLSFDSLRKVGSDSVYCNFYRLEGNMFNSPHCNFWGSTMCYKQNVPVWAGRDIKYNNAGIYQFYNLAGDTLTFNFNKNPGDSSVFYRNSSEKFVFKYIKADTVTVLNNLDSARFYIIHHTDLNGNVINSSMHNKYITVAKNFGLTDFMQVDSFPLVLRPLKLIGNVSPTAGFIKITNEMLYDHQPGDEIQFYDYYYSNYGPPWLNYNKYIKYRYLIRMNIADTINYKAQRSNYNATAGTFAIDTINLKYLKNYVVCTIPYEKYDGNIKRLYKGDYCSLKLWTYTIHPIYSLGFCPADKCWGPRDTNGPPPNDNTTYVCGLGRYSYTSVLAVPPSGYNTGTKIIYFKKNGIFCGNEIVMGMDNTEELLYKVELTPNPASAELTISSSVLIKNIVVFDIMGQKVLSSSVMADYTKIDISKLPEGVYIAKITFNNNKVISKKFIKTNQ